jgi:hypothetical protein
VEGSGVGCGFCGVFDFADEDFDDVFEEEDSGGAAVVVDGSCDVGAGSPHGGEGVFEVGLVVDGGQAPDAFGGDGLVGGVGAGEVHDVFEVEVTGGLSGGVVDAVAGVAGGHDGALQVVGGGVGGEGDHVGDRDFDVGDLLGGELECGGQGSGGVVDEPFAGGLLDDAGDRVEGVGAGCFVFRFDAEQPEDAVRQPVEQPDDRFEDAGDDDEGRASSRAARTGTENERFLGTISPKTTWRKVTRTSATANAVTVMALSVRPVAASGISSR